MDEHISRKVVKKNHIMMVMYRLDPHQVWPLKIHEAEQGDYVFQGKVELNLPLARQTLLLESGDGYLCASFLEDLRGGNDSHGYFQPYTGRIGTQQVCSECS